MKKSKDIDIQLIYALEKIKTGANQHTINKAITYYKSYCATSERDEKLQKRHIETLEVLELLMKRACNNKHEDMRILKWSMRSWF